MIFNDLTNKNGAIQFCEDWVFGGDYGAISDNPTLLLKFTNLINRGLDKTKALINATDGRFQDDDFNYTDIPDATTNLSDGIASYALDRDMLYIQGFEIMNSSGDCIPLYPIDYSDIRFNNLTPTEFQETPGLPIYYDVSNNIVTLFPAPAVGSVTLTDGLKVVYKRESDYFVSTDTDKELGIPRTTHDIPCLYASSEFTAMNTMTDKYLTISKELVKREADIKKLFASRNKDEQLVITACEINSQ